MKVCVLGVTRLKRMVDVAGIAGFVVTLPPVIRPLPSVVGVVPPGSASPEASRRALAAAGALAVLADVHEVEQVAGEVWR